MHLQISAELNPIFLRLLPPLFQQTFCQQTCRILVSGDEASRRYLHPGPHSWAGSAARLLATPPPFFPYLIYGGRYRLGFANCGTGNCDSASVVYSDYVNLQPEVLAHCDPAGFAGNSSILEVDTPAVQGLSALFRFAFSPCSPVQPYDEANVTLHSSQRREECGTPGTSPVLQDRLALERSTNGGSAVIVYQTPELQVKSVFIMTNNTMN